MSLDFLEYIQLGPKNKIKNRRCFVNGYMASNIVDKEKPFFSLYKLQARYSK